MGLSVVRNFTVIFCFVVCLYAGDISVDNSSAKTPNADSSSMVVVQDDNVNWEKKIVGSTTIKGKNIQFDLFSCDPYIVGAQTAHKRNPAFVDSYRLQLGILDHFKPDYRIDQTALTSHHDNV